MCRIPRDSVSIDNPNKTYILRHSTIPRHRIESARRALLDKASDLREPHPYTAEPILTEEQHQDRLDLLDSATTCGRCGATGLVHGMH